MIAKVDLQVAELHAQCCEQFEKQFLFIKNTIFNVILGSSKLEKPKRIDIVLNFVSKKFSSFSGAFSSFKWDTLAIFKFSGYIRSYFYHI